MGSLNGDCKQPAWRLRVVGMATTVVGMAMRSSQKSAYKTTSIFIPPQATVHTCTCVYVVSNVLIWVLNREMDGVGTADTTDQLATQLASQLASQLVCQQGTGGGN